MSKQNAAVSQLAGEIARRIAKEAYYDGEEGGPENSSFDTQQAFDIINAALLSREEKFNRLVDAARITVQHFERNHVSGNFQGDDEHECWNALRSALGE